MTALQSVPRPTRGVVNPAAGEKVFRLERYLPEADLAPFVEHFWLVAWTLPDGVVHVQRTLPSPCIHVVFDAGRTAVFGVMTGSFEYTQRGAGRVLGVRFRPGAFRAFLKAELQSITNRELPLSATELALFLEGCALVGSRPLSPPPLARSALRASRRLRNRT